MSVSAICKMGNWVLPVVGLGFGAEFVPIYLDHPDVESVTICDKDETRLHSVGDRFGIKHRVSDVQDIVEAPDIDAVHLITGIPDHASQAVAVLNAGKHCACTVPMATSLVDLRAIVVPDQTRQYSTEHPLPPDCADMLPPEIGKYTRRFVYNDEHRHLSFEQGGGHHGSHPHLVHEFLRSIVEQRAPWIDAVTATNWTAAGICAHESAMHAGAEVIVPLFG
jgi:Oxidoreductase family, NAD-binding Rossmann fold